MPLTFHDPVTVERPGDAKRHSDPPGDQSPGGASSQPPRQADPFGAHDAAADFGPEGGPRIYRAPDAPGPDAASSGEADGPSARPAEPGAGEEYAYNADGTPRYNADGSRTKKRGRKAGAQSGPRKAPPLRVAGIESILLSTHGMLAALTQFEDFALEEKEAKDLAGGIAAVAEHYPMVHMSEKDKAWLGLFAISASIYGPRAFLAFKAAQKARAERARGSRPQPPAVVQPIRPDPRPTPKPAPASSGGFPAFIPDA